MDEVVTVNHYMSPALTFISVAAAILLDWFGVGPDSWKDRVASLLYLAGIREGWNGGAIDNWLCEKCSWVIDITKSTGNAHLRDADTAQIIGGLLALLMAYFLLAWFPNWRWIYKTFGKWISWTSKINLPKSSAGRINVKVILMCVPLGLMSDLIPGWSGRFVCWCLDNICKVIDFCFGRLL